MQGTCTRGSLLVIAVVTACGFTEIRAVWGILAVFIVVDVFVDTFRLTR